MEQQDLFDYIIVTRKLFGISHKDVADYVGLSRTQILNIEAGRCRCSLPTFLMICDYLDISLSDFKKGVPIAKKKLVKERNKKISSIEKQVVVMEAKIKRLKKKK